MKSARVWFLLALLPLLAACTYNTILHEEPLGEIATLDPQEWSGLWLMGRNDVHPKFVSFNVVDGKKGIMQVRVLQMNEGCPLLLKYHNLYQWRRIGNWYFLTPDPVRSYDDRISSELSKYAPYSTTLAFFRSKATLILYALNPARARALILRKQIPGRIVDDWAILEKLSSKQHKLLFPYGPINVDRDPETALPPAVHWEWLQTLVKLPDQLVPCK